MRRASSAAAAAASWRHGGYAADVLAVHCFLDGLERLVSEIYGRPDNRRRAAARRNEFHKRLGDLHGSAVCRPRQINAQATIGTAAAPAHLPIGDSASQAAIAGDNNVLKENEC